MKPEFINTSLLLKKTHLQRLLSLFPHRLTDTFGNTISCNLPDELDGISDDPIAVNNTVWLQLSIRSEHKTIIIKLLQQVVEEQVKQDERQHMALSNQVLLGDIIDILYQSRDEGFELMEKLETFLSMLRAHIYVNRLYLFEVKDDYRLIKLLALDKKQVIPPDETWPTEIGHLASVVANSNKSFICNSPGLNFFQQLIPTSEYQAKNFAAMLVTCGNSVKAVLIAINNQTDSFSPKQIRILDIFTTIIYQIISEKAASMVIKNLETTNLNLEKYVDSSVAEEIKTRDSNELEGVTKNLTVMFIRICNFNTIQKELSSKSVIEVLNFYFDAITKVVKKHHGTVDKTVGDMIMIVWGHPFNLDDKEELALKAALEIQQLVVKQIKPVLIKRGLKDFEIGIGLNAGEAIAGNMGAPNFMDFTVIGDTINLAQRLEAKAEKNQIWVHAPVLSAISNLPTKPTNMIKSLKVKGKKKGVHTFIFSPPGAA